ECILSLADSFNFELVTPLIGHDLDEEVAEYRPQAMHTRLLNLQELFAFIFGEGIVKQIEVFLTLDYDIEGLELVDVAPGDFARELERITINNSCSCMGYRFVWGK
ncbi:MAG: hypothetical protein IJW21_06245, partial [Clostridia bacterium]|nr:hypothetical protein [Clostridia bacterium]